MAVKSKSSKKAPTSKQATTPTIKVGDTVELRTSGLRYEVFKINGSLATLNGGFSCTLNHLVKMETDGKGNPIPTDREWPEGDYLPPQPEPVQVERLWNKYGWLISYESIGAGAVLVSRSYYGQALDHREMSVEEARVHYAAQRTAKMEPVPAL